jgi:hypothetical protein
MDMAVTLLDPQTAADESARHIGLGASASARTFFGARCQTNLTEHDSITSPDNEFDCPPYVFQLNSHAREHLRRDTLFFPDQTEQYMFSADVIVVETLGFFLCQLQGLARAIGNKITWLLVKSQVK